jgi:transposase
MNKNNIIGIDLAKNIIHLVEVDHTGKKISQCKVKRNEILSKIPSDRETLITMEACASSNYWAQLFSKLGFSVKIIKTKDAKAYALSKQKNDYNDALAITKAARDPELKTVKPKTKEEQDISFLHKSRMNTIKNRVQKVNSLISSLYEYGFITNFKKSSPNTAYEEIIKEALDDGYISEITYQLLIIDVQEIRSLFAKEKLLDKLIIQCNKANPKAVKLQKVMGIGPINASCLSIAPIETYNSPRDFAASLGLVPKQYSSGDKTILGRITKQGDRYARTMLIQAGRAIAIRAKITKDPKNKLIKWAQKKFAENKPFNVVCVGLANKLARIAYCIIVNNVEYQAD